MKQATIKDVEKLVKHDNHGSYLECPNCNEELHVKTDRSIVVCYNCEFALDTSKIKESMNL